MDGENGISSKKITQNLGFIGAGNMAKAITDGLLKSETIKPSQMYVCAPTNRNLASWKALGVNTSNNNEYALENTDVTVLAMKPQYLDSVLDNIVLSHPLPENHLFISILVGVTLETLQRKLSRFIKSPRVAKVIPNTPMMVQEGCSVFCCTHPADNEVIALVQAIFSKGGICEMIPEPLMNAMGALSGSGPAFVYMIIEALSDGAVKMGIPREMSTRFSAQTLLGAAKMVLETGKHPGQLKDEVCSPGGSTICGVHALELGGLRHALIDAVEAATKRSEEIGKRK